MAHRKIFERTGKTFTVKLFFDKDRYNFRIRTYWKGTKTVHSAYYNGEATREQMERKAVRDLAYYEQAFKINNGQA